ncbi:MAG: hypothetical protein ABSC00_10145, partial [Acidimicrobiales bacterium]
MTHGDHIVKRRGAHSTKGHSLVIVLVAVLGGIGLAIAAWAYFTATGSGSGVASVSSLSAPTGVSGTATGTTVAVSWTGVTPPGSGTFGYYVTRAVASGYSGTGGYACGSSPTSLLAATPTSCNDTSVASGTYTYKVTAVYNTWTATSTASSDVTVNASVLNSFSVVPSTFTPTAGTQFNVTITALDQFSNTYTAYTGTQCVTFSGPSNSPAPSSTAPSYPAKGSCTSGSAVTFVSGVSTGVNAANITLYDAENPLFTVTDNPSGKTGTASLTVIAAALNSFKVPTPSTQTAGSFFNETITALDAYDNAASGWTSVNNCVRFSGPSSSPAPSSSTPSYPSAGSCGTGNSALNFDGSGQVTATITLYDAQSTSLTVTSVTTPAGETGSSGSFTVSASTLNSFKVPTPSTQTAGTFFNETITAVDAWDNPASGWTSGTECVTFSGPSSSPSPSSTAPLYPVPTASCTTGESGLSFNSSGQASATVTLYDAQSTSLTVTSVTSPSGKTGSTGSFTVSAAGLNSFTVPNPGTQTAGSFFNETITAVDAWDNPASGWTSGTECVTFSGPSSSPSPSSTAPLYPVPTASCTTGESGLSFNSSGQASATVTLYD